MNYNIKRAPSFSSEEETCLLGLVGKYKNIIECPKTDVFNNKIKLEIWKQIAREFNLKFRDFPRTPQNLRKKYENLKKSANIFFSQQYENDSLSDIEQTTLVKTLEKYAKFFDNGNNVPLSLSEQHFVELNKSLNKTGGGTAQCSKMSSNEEKTYALFGEKVTGFDSCFDSDSHIKREHNQLDESEDSNLSNEELLPPSILETPSNKRNRFSADENEPVRLWETSNEENIPTTSWAKYTPGKLRTPISAPLLGQSNATLYNNRDKKDKQSTSGSKKHQAKNKITPWGKPKVELANNQKKSYLEEHELKLKLKLITDKARKEIEVMEREAILRMHFAREENEIKKMQQRIENNN